MAKIALHNKQSGRSEAYRATGLAGVVEGDQVILLKIPGVLLSHHGALALLRDAFPSFKDAGAAANAASMHLCHGADNPETYLYVVPEAFAAGDAGAGLNKALALLQDGASTAYLGAQASVLEVSQGVSGASADQGANWHYVVETDVRPEAEGDFNSWYAQEHLPGLAAVPGTVRALRLRDPAGSPRYHALYMLENRETFGSEPWLKVRATEWSSRVRPNFINTKRTMFRIPSVR